MIQVHRRCWRKPALFLVCEHPNESDRTWLWISVIRSQILLETHSQSVRIRAKIQRENADCQKRPRNKTCSLSFALVAVLNYYLLWDIREVNIRNILSIRMVSYLQAHFSKQWASVGQMWDRITAVWTWWNGWICSICWCQWKRSCQDHEVSTAAQETRG